MAVGVINFPLTLDTETELTLPVNGASSAIAAPGVDPVVDIIPVVDTTRAPSSGVAWCGAEAIAFTGKTGSSLTGCTRGFDTTTATLHSTGDPIYFDVLTSAHLRVLRDAVLALETEVGTRESHVRGITGNQTIAIGDSLTKQDPRPVYGDAWSWFTYATWHSSGRIFFQRNSGISGNWLTDMESRFAADVVAYAPDRVIIAGGTNDAASGATLVAMQDAMKSMVDQARAAQIEPVVCAIPVSTIPLAPRRLRVAQYNAWLATWAPTQGILFVDTHTPMVDPTTGDAISGVLRDDNTHLNGKGSRILGEVVADAIAAVSPPVHLPFPPSAIEPTNILSNGTFTGDADANGIADSWMSWGAGSATFSLIPDPGLTGAKLQRTVIAGLASGREGVSQGTATGFSDGDTLRVSVYLATAGTEDGPAEVASYLIWDGAGGIQSLMSAQGDTSGVWSMDVTVPAGATGVRLVNDIGVSATVATATGTLDVGRASIVNLTTLGLTA